MMHVLELICFHHLRVGVILWLNTKYLYHSLEVRMSESESYVITQTACGEWVFEGPTSPELNLTTHVAAKNQWDYNETIALIEGIQNRYEDLYHPKKKKNFWEATSEILSSQKIYFDAATCKRKWENLLRTYKDIKDKKKKTGKGPTRFLYFDLLDSLLGDKPSNCSPHSLDVATIAASSSDVEETSKVINKSDGSTLLKPSASTKQERKRKLPTQDYIEIKRAYYSNKSKLYQTFIEASVENKEELLVLARRKVDLEERKVKALEELTQK